MAYKHILMIFDRPVVGSFEVDKVNMTVSFNEPIIPGGPTENITLNVVSIGRPEVGIEGASLSKQVLIQVDDVLNMADGDITVKYVSGLFGSSGEAVMPFTESFKPLPMPDYYRPRAYEGFNISNKYNMKLNSIDKVNLEQTDVPIAKLPGIVTGIGAITITYVGEVKP